MSDEPSKDTGERVPLRESSDGITNFRPQPQPAPTNDSGGESSGGESGGGSGSNDGDR